MGVWGYMEKSIYEQKVEGSKHFERYGKSLKYQRRKISKYFLSPPCVVEPIFGYSRITLTRASPCRPGPGGLGSTIGGNTQRSA